MKEFFDKYKYYIGGSTISLIIFYLLYEAFIKKTNNSTKESIINFKENKKELKTEISHEEFLIFMETLKKELQTLTQSMIKFNANYIKNNDKYKDFRDKLFTKDIIKKSILIDSQSVGPEDTSNYIVNFGSDIYGEVFKNVIGFRLVKATVPHTLYTVTESNNEIIINDDTSDQSTPDTDTTIDLSPGSYTFIQLGNHLQNKINSTSLSGFTVTSNSTTFKYTISHSSNFTIKWSSSTARDLFGFAPSDTTSTIHISDNAVSQTKHFVDLVIPEIPDIACKMGSKKQIIDRIPLNSPSGSLVYYRSPEAELQTHNYFYPMKLSSLNIQLYDNDTTNLYHANNGHNYFEFEITIVENTDLFK